MFVKKNILILLVLFSFLANNSFAQEKKSSGRKVYSSWGLEWMLSKTDFNDKEDIPRFSAWFNFQSYWHYDFTKNVGFSWGFGFKNLGYIQNVNDNNIYVEHYTHWDIATQKYILDKETALLLSQVKRMSYSVDFPLLVRIGDLKKSNYLFLGASLNIPFYYKEKAWIDNEKKKYTAWFTDKLRPFLPIVFVGYQFPFGMSLKFSYAWEGIMNPSYKVNEQFVYKNRPLFMLSIGTYMFSVDKKINKRL